jgi:hypothetical protein
MQFTEEDKNALRNLLNSMTPEQALQAFQNSNKFSIIMVLPNKSEIAMDCNEKTTFFDVAYNAAQKYPSKLSYYSVSLDGKAILDDDYMAFKLKEYGICPNTKVYIIEQK